MNDVVRFDTQTGDAQKVFDGSAFFDNNENVDAVDLLSNGNLLISTTSNSSIDDGSQSFSDGDLLEIDISGTTPSFVSRFLIATDLYEEDEDIDGFSTLSGSSGFATTSGSADANSIDLDDGDVIRFDLANPSTTASLYFDDDVECSSSADIDAISILSDNTMAISTLGSESIDGNAFERGDVVVLARDGATWAFSEILFDGSDENFGFGSNVTLNAVHVVPEPASLCLLLVGLLLLTRVRV